MTRFQKRAAALLLAGAMSLPAVSALARHDTPPPPSDQEIQRMIESRLGADIEWTNVRGHLPGAKRMTGTGSIGEASIEINCHISYPPLRIRCTISFEL